MQSCADRTAQALAGRLVSSQRAETGEVFPLSVWCFALAAMASVCMMQTKRVSLYKAKQQQQQI